MRRLLTVIMVLAAVWCGWWWIASTAMTRALTLQIEQLQTQGWQIESDTIASSGFPQDLRKTITNVRLTDPANLTYEIPSLRLVAKAYWPGHARVLFPNAPIVLSQAGQPILFIILQNASASLRLHPSSSLELQSLTAQSGPWVLNTPNGNLLSANDLSIGFVQQSDSSDTYDFDLDAHEVSPGDVLRAAMQTPRSAPLAFDAYTANGTVQLDRPLDRHLTGRTAPKPTALALNKAEVTWGNLSLSSSANLTFDDLGTPDGALTAKAQNWQEVLEYAEVAGVLPASNRQQVTLMLGVFANMSGTPDDIELTVRAKNGQLNVNGIGLGAVPKLFSR